jgi:hypothetical protein
VEEAAGTWNAVPNVGFSFDFQGEANANYDTTTCSSYTYNGVFERDWVSFGLTLWCYKANGNLEHIALLFQSGSDAFWDISPEDTVHTNSSRSRCTRWDTEPGLELV